MARESDERRTPPELFEPLNRLFHFNLDPCASYLSSLGIAFEWPSMMNGLEQSWQGHSVFVNPPYSQMMKWAVKAVSEAMAGNCFVAFILPNDATTAAYKYLESAAWGCWRPPFRVKFIAPDGSRRDVSRSHVVFFVGGLPTCRPTR